MAQLNNLFAYRRKYALNAHICVEWKKPQDQRSPLFPKTVSIIDCFLHRGAVNIGTSVCRNYTPE